MATKKRRSFGGIRRLPSGRWQAFYQAPDGRRRTAETPFDSKTDADRWLAVVRSELIENRWHDPDLGRETVNAYVTRWIAERSGLRPRTRDLYVWLHRRYIEKTIGQRELRHVNAAAVRSWRAGLLSEGVSATMAAKAYRLLRAAFNTAVDDGLVLSNPCRLPGAGTEKPDERPTLSAAEVFKLAELMPERYSALILLAAFGSLRWGEATALRRMDLDLDQGLVFVRAAVVEIAGQGPTLAPPKTEASFRTVALPEQVVEVLRVHLAEFVGLNDQATVFTGSRGNLMRRGNFNPLVNWSQAAASIGKPGLHFHDLRHTGNTLASGIPGTTVRDLMERMGHVSMRAALIYMHKTTDGDRRIAQGLTTQIAASASDGSASASARGVHAGGSE